MAKHSSPKANSRVSGTDGVHLAQRRLITRRTLLELVAGVAAMAPGVVHGSPGTSYPPIGINLAGITYWSTEQPFENLAAGASRWRVQKLDQPFTWDIPLPPLSEDGYPLAVPANSFIESFLMGTPHRKHLPVKLSLRYEGKGMLGYSGGAELDKRSPGHDLVRNLRREDSFTLALLKTDRDDPVRNIRLYERDRNPTDTYRQSFLDRMRGMSTIRFMEWMKANETNVSTWDERPKPGKFADASNGVPLEYMIELANIVHAAPWFTMPHKADDDFNERFATMVRSKLDPSLPVYVEYSNEVWNGISDQTRDQGYVGLILLIVSINMVDMLPNATITPLTWLFAGALLGYAEAVPSAASAPITQPARMQRIG